MREAATGVRIVVVLMVIFVGIAGMVGLKHLRKDPPQHSQDEMKVNVRAVQVWPETVQVTLEGLATASSKQQVEIRPEVSGRIVWVAPGLEAGQLFQAGEPLLRIDPRDYQLQVDEAHAEEARLTQQIAQIRQQQVNDRKRLEVLQASLELAERNLQRIENLANDGGVESRSRVEATEITRNNAKDQCVTLENALALYPIEIRHLEAQLMAAVARREQAELNLERTEIKAPFTGHIESEDIEPGRLATAGQTLATLQDGSILELAVPLKGEEVIQWLEIEPEVAGGRNWYGRLPEREVDVIWTEAEHGKRWQGKLDRIERYDPANRTITLVVQVTENAARPDAAATAGLRLVDGMFCKVMIPGRVLKDVYRVPATSLINDNEVFVVDDGRMHHRQVEVLRHSGRDVLIGQGLSDGETVLISRPSVELDGVRVNVTTTSLNDGNAMMDNATSAPLALQLAPVGQGGSQP